MILVRPVSWSILSRVVSNRRPTCHKLQPSLFASRNPRSTGNEWIFSCDDSNLGLPKRWDIPGCVKPKLAKQETKAKAEPKRSETTNALYGKELFSKGQLERKLKFHFVHRKLSSLRKISEIRWPTFSAEDGRSTKRQWWDWLALSHDLLEDILWSSASAHLLYSLSRFWLQFSVVWDGYDCILRAKETSYGRPHSSSLRGFCEKNKHSGWTCLTRTRYATTGQLFRNFNISIIASDIFFIVLHFTEGFTQIPPACQFLLKIAPHCLDNAGFLSTVHPWGIETMFRKRSGRLIRTQRSVWPFVFLSNCDDIIYWTFIFFVFSVFTIALPVLVPLYTLLAQSS